jgi:hypothetical protein
MTLAWLQLSYRQTEAYSFSTETAVAFITAKIVASLRDTALLPPKSPIPVTKGSHLLPVREHCLLFGDRDQGFLRMRCPRIAALVRNILADL